MTRKSLIAACLLPAAVAVAACAPPPQIRQPAMVRHPVPACAGPRVTFQEQPDNEDPNVPCEIQPGQHMDFHMLPTVINGQTWNQRCLNFGGHMVTDGTAGDYMCFDVDF